MGLLSSAGSRGGAGLNAWIAGLVVWPVFNLLDVLKVVGAGRLGFVDTGLGLLEATG